jgi:cyanobactin biosynthesis protein (PatB/AcyB/McaB family)
MRLPKQAPPVKRPELIATHRAVDLIHGQLEDLISLRMDLLHGANFNDPPTFRLRSYQQLKTSGGGGGGSCWGGLP